MHPIRLTKQEIADVIDALTRAKFDVLVAVDPIDQAFKVKIDGGTWSPPLGAPVA